MNAHQEKILEIEQEIAELTRSDIDEFGNPIQLPKPGKRRQVEAMQLRLWQAWEASEACERAKLLLR